MRRGSGGDRGGLSHRCAAVQVQNRPADDHRPCGRGIVNGHRVRPAGNCSLPYRPVAHQPEACSRFFSCLAPKLVVFAQRLSSSLQSCYPSCWSCCPLVAGLVLPVVCTPFCSFLFFLLFRCSCFVPLVSSAPRHFWRRTPTLRDEGQRTGQAIQKY